MTNEKLKLGRYANIKLDRWFKRTFGVEERKHLLVGLLRELLPEHDFEDLQYAGQEFINENAEDYKSIRVDVSARDSDGTRVIVEMQMTEQDNYYERIAFNAAFPVTEQKDIGDEENDFPTVYMVNLMNFSYHERSDQVLYRGRFRWDDTNEAITDRVQLLFLELPNCTKALTPEATFADNFCYVMLNIENLEEIPPQLDTEYFRDLFKSAEIANFTPSEKRKYRKDMMDQQSIAMGIKFQRRVGREEGLKEGLEKGLEKGRVEIARAMLKDGQSPSLVSKYTGLSESELKDLALI
ncbi:MAG: Rpn family recombination-promoting nuclease/putative transposase [Bacteroidales bacterium]|nr:Rpn family recombination-promoting nuclease/putative transposase [Bacteroidales bacterium]